MQIFPLFISRNVVIFKVFYFVFVCLFFSFSQPRIFS